MQTCAISAASLGGMLESFLADSPRAIAVENGEPIFDFATARYSVSGEGKCVLHLWSEERNAVRRVLDAELKSRVLQPHRAALWTVSAQLSSRSVPTATAAPPPYCAPFAATTVRFLSAR